MKIIDWESKGNVVRFILGDDKTMDYWGDDWNNAPYEHNAGQVYDKFVTGFCDITFPFDYVVYEPNYGESNNDYSKETMKKRIIPCLVVIPDFAVVKDDWNYTFAKALANEKAIKFYFGDKLNPTKEVKTP